MEVVSSTTTAVVDDDKDKDTVKLIEEEEEDETEKFWSSALSMTTDETSHKEDKRRVSYYVRRELRSYPSDLRRLVAGVDEENLLTFSPPTTPKRRMSIEERSASLLRSARESFVEVGTKSAPPTPTAPSPSAPVEDDAFLAAEQECRERWNANVHARRRLKKNKEDEDENKIVPSDSLSVAANRILSEALRFAAETLQDSRPPTPPTAAPEAKEIAERALLVGGKVNNLTRAARAARRIEIARQIRDFVAKSRECIDSSPGTRRVLRDHAGMIHALRLALEGRNTDEREEEEEEHADVQSFIVETNN